MVTSCLIDIIDTARTLPCAAGGPTTVNINVDINVGSVYTKGHRAVTTAIRTSHTVRGRCSCFTRRVAGRVAVRCNQRHLHVDNIDAIGACKVVAARQTTKRPGSNACQRNPGAKSVHETRLHSPY